MKGPRRAGTGKPDKRPTIHDVATRSGMSTLTVSRVLNDHPSIKPSTRLRIEKAMGELNYQPSAFAQNMRRKTTRVVGFLMPDFAHGVSAVVAQNVERILHAAGYSVMLGCSHFDPATECEVLTVFERSRVDAVLLKTCDETSPAIARRVRAMSCPVLLVDRDLPVPVDAVVCDHRTMMIRAVLDLAELGHRRIALIPPSRRMRPGRERIAGFLDGMARAGLTGDPGLVADGGNSALQAAQEVGRLMTLPDPPTALIAAGNQILYGAIEALNAREMAYPRAVSLIGADHPSLGRVMNPTITMIDREPARLAEAAAGLLLSRLGGTAPAGAQRVVLPSRLVSGGSCRRIEVAARTSSAVGAGSPGGP